MRLAAGAALLLPLPAQAGAVIAEVFFDPVGIDTAAEWIEIVNAGVEDQDFSGWQLYPDASGYFSFPAGFALGAGKSAVVHLRRSGTASAVDLYHVQAKANMGNTAGSAALFSGEPRGSDTIKSFVQWGRAGETWEPAASEAGLWQKGSFVGLAQFTEGNSIARIPGISASGVEAWRVSTNPVPGVSSGGPDPPSSAPASPQAQTLPSSGSISPASVSRIVADAGGDRRALAGIEVAFSGRARGLAGETIPSARFLWNFGDGSVAEGPSARHTFRIPGVYRLGLHVSFGSDAASDYLTVTVAPNHLAITDVLSGADGYVRIANTGSADADVGGWLLEDEAGRRFSFPEGTKIAGNSSAAFLNGLTGLGLSAASSSAVFLRFSNGLLASEFRPAASVPASVRGAPSLSVSPGPEARTAPPAVPEPRFVPDVPPEESASRPESAAAPSAAAPGAPAEAPRPFRPPVFLLIAAGIGAIGALGFIIAKMFLF